MLGAGEIPILRGCENTVVTAGCGAGMIVPVSLNLVIIILVIIIILAIIIILVIIPVNVRLHDLMFIRLAIVLAILRADQRRRQCGHRESRQ
ncbi:MAG TPA: hypothetical protein VIY68_10950 [Steroidobacteraceae bacterium]